MAHNKSNRKRISISFKNIKYLFLVMEMKELLIKLMHSDVSNPRQELLNRLVELQIPTYIQKNTNH